MFTITKEAPPIWDVMVREFGMRPWSECPDLVVAYGDSIHTHRPIPPDVVAHERTHLAQQSAFPGGPEAFMRRYMNDTAFKLKVEVEAYRAQLAFIAAYGVTGREFVRARTRLARILSGPLYGRMISCRDADKALYVPTPH